MNRIGPRPGSVWRTLLAVVGALFLVLALPSVASAHDAHHAGWTISLAAGADMHPSLAGDRSADAGACECCVGAPCCHAAMGANDAVEGLAFGTVRTAPLAVRRATDRTSSPNDPPPRPRLA